MMTGIPVYIQPPLVLFLLLVGVTGGWFFGRRGILITSLVTTVLIFLFFTLMFILISNLSDLPVQSAKQLSSFVRLLPSSLIFVFVPAFISTCLGGLAGMYLKRFLKR